MKKQIICLKTNEQHKRGSKYEIFSCNISNNAIKLIIYDETKNKIVVNADDFDFEKDEVVNFVRWEFDDHPSDIDSSFFSWLEITLYMSDGSKRWCKLFTPSLLAKVLERDSIDPPGIELNGFIAVRSFQNDDIERMLRYLEDENLLSEYSLPYENVESEE